MATGASNAPAQEFIDTAIQAAEHLIISVQPSPVEVEQIQSTLDLNRDKHAAMLLHSVRLNFTVHSQQRESLHALEPFRAVEQSKAFTAPLPGTDLYGYTAIVEHIIKAHTS